MTRRAVKLVPRTNKKKPAAKVLTARELELLTTAALNLKLANDEATAAGRSEGWNLYRCVWLTAVGLSFNVRQADVNRAVRWAELIHEKMLSEEEADHEHPATV